MATDAYFSLSGDEVTLSGDALDLSLPWSGSVSYLQAGTQFGFQTGPVGAAADAMLDFPGFLFTDSYESQGGRLQIGSVAIEEFLDDESPMHFTNIWTASWEGDAFSLFTFQRGAEDLQLPLIAMFENFAILEGSAGIVLQPVDGKGVDLFGAQLTKEIPQLGLLNIVGAREADGLLPPGAGTNVRGGELFVDPHNAFFVLANNRAVTTIQPLDDETVDAEMLDRVERLFVNWQS